MARKLDGWILLLALGCSGGGAFEATDESAGGHAGETEHGGSAGESGETGGANTGGATGRTGGSGGGSSGDAGETATGGSAGDDTPSGGSDPGGGGGSGGCVPKMFYVDNDEDGFGDDNEAREACEAPDGFVDVAGDCDDFDESIHPDAEEACDGVDRNCVWEDGNGCPPGCDNLGDVALCSAPADWHSAKTACEAMGMLLTASPEQVAAANGLMTDLAPFWIGASDTVNEGDWIWPNGVDVFGAGPWAAGEPSADSEDDDCGVSSGVTGPGEWSSEPCSSELPYACFLAQQP